MGALHLYWFQQKVTEGRDIPNFDGVPDDPLLQQESTLKPPFGMMPIRQPLDKRKGGWVDIMLTIVWD